MSFRRGFWIVSIVWIVAIVAAAPLLVEVLDDAGLGVSIPGLPVTGAEILLIGVLAFGPPLVARFVIRRTSAGSVVRRS
jgi:hypothetical protein